MKYSDLKLLDETIKSVVIKESPSDECPEGQYFCNGEQKCKSIPSGHKVMQDGTLIKEWTFDEDFGGILESLSSPDTVKRITTSDLQSTYNWLIKGAGQRLYKDQKDLDWQKAAEVIRKEVQKRAKSGDEIAKRLIGDTDNTKTKDRLPVLKSTVRKQIAKKPSAMKALIKKILGNRM